MRPKRPNDIDKKRAEILRLIAKVNAGDRSHAGGGRPSVREPGQSAHHHAAPPAAPGSPARTARREADDKAAAAAGATHRDADGATAAPARARRPQSDRLEARRQELTEVRKLRKRLEAAAPSSRLFEVLSSLERRMEGIEEMLRTGNATAPALDTEPEHAQLPGGHDYDMGGVLREGLLADMLQLVSSNVMSGEFVVTADGEHIHLYFFEGEIVHAEGPDMHGESAVFAAMAVDEGRYYFRETSDIPEERTIESKTQFLILEALRRVDEDRMG